MDSDSSEESKKRKAAGEKYTVFAKSKMIARSPEKQQKGEEKLDVIINMMKECKLDQREIKDELQKLGAEQELIKEKLISIQQENIGIEK
ncbi:hypothetical protein QE152_g19074 [Popillia japonica]|uniref:Uncharacterized protein n=1 Tax=Popillia japonica TaxID=7064 RepID=A0AAW1L3T4_POPJA